MQPGGADLSRTGLATPVSQGHPQPTSRTGGQTLFQHITYEEVANWAAQQGLKGTPVFAIARPGDSVPELSGFSPGFADAKKLLAEAGYPTGFDLKLSLPRDDVHMRVGDFVAKLWGQIGVKVSIDHSPVCYPAHPPHSKALAQPVHYGQQGDTVGVVARP